MNDRPRPLKKSYQLPSTPSPFIFPLLSPFYIDIVRLRTRVWVYFKTNIAGSGAGWTTCGVAVVSVGSWC